MTITINCNNPYRANRVHNYFYNKGVQVMLCNDDTSVSLFNLDRDRAELLLAALELPQLGRRGLEKIRGNTAFLLSLAYNVDGSFRDAGLLAG